MKNISALFVLIALFLMPIAMGIQMNIENYWVSGSGALGLGTNTPQKPLHIRTIGTGEPTIRLDNTGANPAVWDIIATSQGGFGVSRSGSMQLFVDNNGAVGIGTEAPQKKLDVAGDAIISGATTLSSTLAVSGATTVGGTLGVGQGTTVGGTLGVSGATTLSGALHVVGATSLGSTLGVTGVTTLKDITVDTGTIKGANGIKISSTATGRNDIFIDASGKVGIGNGEPQKKLDVNGDARIGGATTLSNTLAVSGATTVGSTLGVTGDTTLSGKLDVIGESNIGGKLKVQGTTELQSGLTVGGLTTVNNNLAVTGQTTVDDITAAGTVQADTLCAGTLCITQATTFNSCHVEDKTILGGGAWKENEWEDAITCQTGTAVGAGVSCGDDAAVGGVYHSAPNEFRLKCIKYWGGQRFQWMYGWVTCCE